MKNTLANFCNFYEKIYKDRWEQLKESLLKEKTYTQIDGLLKPYFIDPSSKCVIDLLEIKDYDVILDCCSAPGGKAICLLNKLNHTNSLYCNELSKERRLRLNQNFKECLPAEKLSLVKRVTGFDACKIGLFQKEMYDLIILDAPCSSERHVLQDVKNLKNWSPTKSKRLQTQSHTMLQSSLMAAKSGGKIIYITCSISPFENDLVIKRTKDKGKFSFEILSSPSFDFAEKTEYGFNLFPDKFGSGPLYFSILQKN